MKLRILSETQSSSNKIFYEEFASIHSNDLADAYYCQSISPSKKQTGLVLHFPEFILFLFNGSQEQAQILTYLRLLESNATGYALALIPGKNPHDYNLAEDEDLEIFMAKEGMKSLLLPLPLKSLEEENQPPLPVITSLPAKTIRKTRGTPLG